MSYVYEFDSTLPPGSVKRRRAGVITLSQDLYDEWLESLGAKVPKPHEVIETRPGRCECGSEAVGSTRHATYCPAFEK